MIEELAPARPEPAAESAAQRLSALGQRSHRREADELAQGFARAFAYGGVIYLAFFAVDALIFVEREAPLWLLFGLRVIGAVVFFVASAELLRRPRSLAATTAWASATMALTAALGAIIGGSTGGLANTSTAGIAYYFLGSATFGPSPWRRMLALTLPTWVAYFVTLLVVSPTPEGGLPAPFVADLVIALGLAAFAAIGGEFLWRSRRHIAQIRHLGRYRLDALVERDALGETWRAHDISGGADVVLELYRARPLLTAASPDPGALTFPLSESQRARFIEAARAVAALSSPHTMRIYDCDANDDGIAFIARDFIPGERLDSLVRRTGPLEAHRAIRLGRQLAAALTEAHRRGVSHRDLRPWNALLAEDVEGRDTLRVVGWGLSDLVRRPEARDALLLARGPGLFAPPEAPAGSGVRADVYGLGAVLFWCLTGQAPVELRAGEAPWRAYARAPVPRPSALRGELLPTGLDALILACLDRDPLQRPEDASRVLSELERLPVPR